MGFFENAFISILNMSITASYVAIAVIIGRLLLKKAPKEFSYSLWSVVLFRLFCPLSFSFEFSLLGLIQPTQTGTYPTQYIPQDIGMMTVPKVDTGIDSLNAAINASIPAATPFASVNPVQIWIYLATLIWLIGAAVLLMYAVISYLRLRRQISTATLVSQNIYETDLLQSSFVFGFIKPKIYLPLCLTGHEREYILCHEQTHIKRLDYLVKTVAYFALVLHWFNPLMWLCFSLMTKDMEMSCDERVIRRTTGQDIAVYCSSLLALATQKKIPGPSPLAFGESNVKARINNILNYKQPKFWVIIILVFSVITLVVVLISNPSISPSKNEHPGAFLGANSLRTPNAKDAYDVEYLMKNKTQYIGDNSKVVALIDALPLQKSVTRDSIELATTKAPYGVTINYSLNDDSIVINEEQFLRNSVLLFAMIDNAEVVTHMGSWNNKALSSIPFKFIYTRADAERILGGDVRQFAKNRESLAEFIDKVKVLGVDWKSQYKVINKVKFHVLINEYLDSNDKNNPDVCLLVRDYWCFDGTGDWSQVYPLTNKIVLPKSSEINNALDFKKQIIKLNPNTSLKLPENTIINKNVLNQWNEEKYYSEFEYSKDSPKGLTYEMLLKSTQKFSNDSGASIE